MTLDLWISKQKVKYGVVSINRLCEDLDNWSTLYLSGRLQKPVSDWLYCLSQSQSKSQSICTIQVHIIKDHPQVQTSMQANLQAAVNCALLRLPSQFTDHQLFCSIAGLSYLGWCCQLCWFKFLHFILIQLFWNCMFYNTSVLIECTAILLAWLGDMRMRFGENPNKVSNIVTPNLQHFKLLYKPSLVQTQQHGLIEFDSDASNFRVRSRLPFPYPSQPCLHPHSHSPSLSI